MKTVERAAVKTPTGKVIKAPVGGRHKDIKGPGKEGFVLSDGKFVNRQDAGKIAKKSGQATKMPTKHLHVSNLKK